MEGQARHDLEICGVGRASGGVFGNVNIEGTAQITGHMECLDFTVDGVARISGNVKARNGKVNGVVTISGGWQSDQLVVSGFSKIGGNVGVKQIIAEGFSSLAGNVSAEAVEVTGHIKIKGDCSAETFASRGVFRIGGMLNAGAIDILSLGNCRARDIGGERVAVRRNNPNILARLLTSVLFRSTASLVAESVEADDVYLEYSTVKVVRGNNVHLGPGCRVDRVEYRDSFERDSGAEIKEVQKTGAGADTQ